MKLLLKIIATLALGLHVASAIADPACPPTRTDYEDSDIIGYKNGCIILKENSSSSKKPPSAEKTPPRKELRKTSDQPWFKRQDCAALEGFKVVVSTKADIRTIEYSFFVIMEPDPAGGKHFTYTEAIAGSSGGTKAPWPTKGIVKAHLHTHPSHYSFQGFSPQDRLSFLDANERHPDTTWYLRSPLGGILKATTEKDFPHGKVVTDSSCE